MLDRTRFEHEIASLQYDVPPIAKKATTCYLPIARNATLKGKMTGVYVPSAARSATTLDVIVYFHGFVDSQCHKDWKRFEKEGIEFYWQDTLFRHLRPELEASGRAALLVAPTMHPLVGIKGSGNDRHGDLHVDFKFDALIDEVFRQLRAKGAIDAAADVGNIVLAAHSGGGMPMTAILVAKNKYGGKIRACWGFESLYFGTGNYNRWLKAVARSRFRHFRRKTHFKSETAALAARMNFTDTAGTIGHCELVQAHWSSLLGTLPTTAGDPKASFELEVDQDTELETALDEVKPVAPRCVAEGFDLIAKARSLDDPKGEHTKEGTPYMREARRYFDSLGDAYLMSKTKGGFSLRALRDAKEYELGNAYMSRARERLFTLWYATTTGGKIGGLWDSLDTTMKAARYFFEIAADEGVSKELGDARPYRPNMFIVAKKLGLRPCEARVYFWIKRNRRYFTDNAKKFGISAVAPAAAIAWEAIENPMFFTLRSVGPGKPHVRTSQIPGLGSDDTLAKQVETAGYLPKRSEAERQRLLKTASGAIEYITAMMAAAANMAEDRKFDIRKNPAVLTAFYQAFDLNTWKAHLAKKQAKGETTFQPLDRMAKWTLGKLKMLRRAVGEKA